MNLSERIGELSKEYNSDGAEYYYDEGYLRATADHAHDFAPNDRPDVNDLVPKIYWNDYIKGYDDGYEEFPEF